MCFPPFLPESESILWSACKEPHVHVRQKSSICINNSLKVIHVHVCMYVVCLFWEWPVYLIVCDVLLLPLMSFMGYFNNSHEHPCTIFRVPNPPSPPPPGYTSRWAYNRKEQCIKDMWIASQGLYSWSNTILNPASVKWRLGMNHKNHIWTLKTMLLVTKNNFRYLLQVSECVCNGDFWSFTGHEARQW